MYEYYFLSVGVRLFKPFITADDKKNSIFWQQDLFSVLEKLPAWSCSLIRTNIQCLCLTAECSPWSDLPLPSHLSDISVMNKLSRLLHSLSKSLFLSALMVYPASPGQWLIRRRSHSHLGLDASVCCNIFRMTLTDLTERFVCCLISCVKHIKVGGKF